MEGRDRHGPDTFVAVRLQGAIRFSTRIGEHPSPRTLLLLNAGGQGRAGASASPLDPASAGANNKVSRPRAGRAARSRPSALEMGRQDAQGSLREDQARMQARLLFRRGSARSISNSG